VTSLTQIKAKKKLPEAKICEGSLEGKTNKAQPALRSRNGLFLNDDYLLIISLNLNESQQFFIWSESLHRQPEQLHPLVNVTPYFCHIYIV